MATGGAPSRRPVEPQTGKCGFLRFWTFSKILLINYPPATASIDLEKVMEVWKAFLKSLRNFFILVIPISDAYFVIRKTTIFLDIFNICLILLDSQLGAYMLEYAPEWNGYSNCARNAAIHPNSMRLKYDEGVTLFFWSVKKLWDLATGGAPYWSTCEFSTSKFGKFWDSEDFARNPTPDCISGSCKYGGRLIWR